MTDETPNEQPKIVGLPEAPGGSVGIQLVMTLATLRELVSMLSRVELLTQSEQKIVDHYMKLVEIADQKSAEHYARQHGQEGKP